jgi:CRP-like cAMP-binding protein
MLVRMAGVGEGVRAADGAAAAIRWFPVLDVDPELARGIPVDERVRARQTVVAPVQRVPAGAWDALAEVERDPSIVGYYVLDGVVSREVPVAGRGLPQLLHRGDVVPVPVRASSTVPADVRLHAIGDAAVAVLGVEFARAAARWPPVLAAFHRRLSLQDQRLAAQGAIGQLPRVEQRLLALFWLLAEDWGKVSGDSVAIPLRLTHQELGRYVGARRPTVSLALKELEESGRLRRRDDGNWLLPSEHEPRLAEELGTADGRAAVAVTVLPRRLPTGRSA